MESIKTFTIRPVQRHSFQSRHLQRFYVKDSKSGAVTSEKIMNKTKAKKADGDSCIDVLKFRPHDYDRSLYNAGLTEQVPNPFYESVPEKREERASQVMSENNLHEDWRPVIKGLVANKTFSKQQELEIRFMSGHAPGTLTERRPSKRLNAFRSVIDPSAERTELMNFKCVLYDRTNRFNTNTLKGALTWQLVNGRHPMIAQSLDRVNPVKHSWYIAEEYEDEKLAVKYNDMMDEATYSLVELKKKYPATDVLEENVLYHMASIIRSVDGKPLIKDKATHLRISETLSNYLRPKVKVDVKFNVEQFNDVVELFTKNPSLFYAKYLVQQALNVNVFQINNSKVYWLSKRDMPDVYTFTSTDAITKFVFEEMSSPESTYFNGLIAELKNKGVVIPKALN